MVWSKLVSVDDFSIRPARSLTPKDVLTTGNYRFRFYPSPHIPHGWDAGVLFEETRRTLFCSDLFHHFGNVEPVTQADLIGRTRDALKQMQCGPLAGYMPYTIKTESVLRKLAELKPEALAVMHGSSFVFQSSPSAAPLVDLSRLLCYTRCMTTTTLTVRISPQKKRRAMEKAAPKSLSAWVHELIDRELEQPAGADWESHFQWLQEHGREVQGHPDDALRRSER